MRWRSAPWAWSTDVDVKQISRKATREGRHSFEVFKVKKRRRAASRKEMAMGSLAKTKESARGKSLEDKRKRCAAFEDASKRMLKYLEDSEDVKMGLSELKEQLETPEETGISIMQIAKEARKEGGHKLFQIFRQGEKEVYIVSLARWNT